MRGHCGIATPLSYTVRSGEGAAHGLPRSPTLPRIILADEASRSGGRSGDGFLFLDSVTCVSNSYICIYSADKRLRERQKIYREDRPFVDENGMLRYRASKLDCGAYALKPRCCPTQPARKILRSAHEGARDLATTDAYLVSRRQRKKVEMLFAHLKRILRMDCLRLRGPNGARGEFLLAATAQNLRKMARLVPMSATPA